MEFICSQVKNQLCFVVIQKFICRVAAWRNTRLKPLGVPLTRLYMNMESWMLERKPNSLLITWNISREKEVAQCFYKALNTSAFHLTVFLKLNYNQKCILFWKGLESRLGYCLYPYWRDFPSLFVRTGNKITSGDADL